MGDKTRISWTDATWNPIRGCSRVSKGCENCYAERVAHRFGGPGRPYEGLTRDGRWNGKIRIVANVLDKPLRWRKPRRIFVNSMSDLFHPGIDEEIIVLIFEVMATAAALNGHTFQVLTKRPDWMREIVSRMSWRFGLTSILGKHILTHRAQMEGSPDIGGKDLGWRGSPPGVWLGVSTENQETADERIPSLLKTPAAVRFISAEPLLGPIDIDPALDWVIVGGESGPGARPCDVGNVRSIVEQCRDAGVPVFVKQLGAHPYLDVIGDESEIDVSEWFGGAEVGWNDSWESWFPRLRSRKGDDPNEWPDDLRVQEFPRCPS